MLAAIKSHAWHERFQEICNGIAVFLAALLLGKRLFGKSE
jgi:hypothetical protein